MAAPRVQAGSAISEWNPVISGLKKMYKEKVRPVEEMYKFGEFMSPVLNDADIEARPMVLLLGQYSTGKTSFIKYMLGRDFPGAHIGPEPTTDRFMAVMYGAEERTIPGNALSVQADRPFRGLSKFGTSFLCKFESSELPAPILESITFLDTPGVLAGEKQRIGRAYDFTSVIHWFAEKADLILLLFDANKLDISDEFKGAIETLKGHDDKIRVVLNKADSVSSQQLMRVYGALMWYLGKVVKTPEVVRVYIGSFWHQPLKNEELRGLFEVEQSELLRDLRNLPRNAAIRKLNDMVKRVRQVKLHAMLISTLRGEMPAFFGKSSKKSELIENLEEVFFKVHQATQIPVGDFPDVNVFRQQLSTYDLKKFPKLDKRMIEMLDEALSGDLARLMQFFPKAVDTGPKYLEPTIQSAMDQIHQNLPPLMPRPGSTQESPRQQQQQNPYGQPQQPPYGQSQQGYATQGAQPPSYPPQQQQQYSQYPQQAPPPQYQQPQQYYNPPQGQASTPPPNQPPYQSQAPTQAPAFQSQAPAQASAYQSQAPTQAPAYQAYQSQAQPNPYGQANPYQSQVGAHTSPYQSQASPYQSQAQYPDPAASMMAPVAASGAAPPPIPPKRPLPQPQQQ